MILCLALITIRPAIDYECAAKPLTVILKELGPSLGKNLTATPEVGRQLMAIRIRNADGADVMLRLAQAANADWADTDDGRRLVRTRAAEARIAKRLIDDFRRGLNAALEEERRRAANLSDADLETLAERLVVAALEEQAGRPSALADLLSLNRHLPASRLLALILPTLDPNDFIGLTDRQMAVYSSPPRPLQLPLPPSALSELERTAQEQARFSKAYLAALEKHKVGENSNFTAWARKPYNNPRPILLVSRLGGRWSFWLNVYSDGYVVDGASKAFAATSGSGPITPPRDDSPLEVSAATAEFLRRDYEFDRVSPDLRKIALEPERYEPLTLSGECLLALASRMDRNLIACLPDGLLGYTRLMRSVQGLAPRVFLRSLDRSGYFAWGVEADWLVLAAYEPATVERHRIDRAALGTFMRATASKGEFDLDDLAQFSLGFTSTAQLSLANELMPLIFAEKAAIRNINFDTLRLLALLPEPMRVHLEKGGALTLAELPEGATRLIAEQLYGPWPPIRNEAPVTTLEEIDMRSGTINLVATELMPTGLPASAKISLTRKGGDTLLFRAFAQGFPQVQPVTPQTAGEYIVGVERRSLPYEAPISFQVIDQQSVTFRFELPHKIVGEMGALVWRSRGPIVSDWRSLPARFHADIEKAVEAARKVQIMSDGRVPPP